MFTQTQSGEPAWFWRATALERQCVAEGTSVEATAVGANSHESGMVYCMSD
ncbi:hypothetical protein [Nostoc sp. T09]|uniref:hypothetical protein n=1 Tax=Nostoc sp. T09 TaxID=1932621 RepID=UPI0015C5181C|nr:hypothetical protein [Nostoc sp. T09]